ncbi:RCC1 domain-containing protein [Catellatospora tritici]|uniref:RCC1 domain-containing protein n=1 Tax=Catellatospora tritici TaxID=2851566 RepID=UPI001C2CEDA0|nr:cell wall anchor protein [Catellatospora tritici]MBV1848993.1 cell wall anchor protein [Catellatospora tritici]
MRLRTTRRRGLGAAALGALLALPVMVAAQAAPAPDGGRHGDKATTAAHGAEGWGLSSDGQLGDGKVGGEPVYTPTAVTAQVPDGVKAVSCGSRHGLWLLSNGTVKSAGANESGQRGNGLTTNYPLPGTVADLGQVTAIAAGGSHNLALLKDGTVRAWGQNDDGQLGDGTFETRTEPVAVTGLTGVIAIAAGGFHSLALLKDGTVRAWGANSEGQLGDGTTTNRNVPVAVTGLTGIRVKAIAAGSIHSVAVTSGGGVKTWGANNDGQLGNGTTSTGPTSTPVDVVDLTGVRVKSVASSGDFTLALLASGRVKGWGSNTNGELGDGTTISPRTRPVDTVGLTGVQTIAAGSSFIKDLPPGGHSLAIAGKTLLAWGSNSHGQLGVGGSGFISTTPLPVKTGLAKPKSICGGNLFSLAA